MSAELLVKNTIYFDTFFIHERASFFPHYFRYLMIFFVGFMPLHLSIFKNDFNEKFLDLLICPKSRQPLIYDKARKKLSSKDGKSSYDVIDGIPKFI